MKTVTKSYTVFKFSELDEDGQSKAINDAIEFISTATPYENLSPEFIKAFEKADAMQTPWFSYAYVWDYAKDEILNFVAEYDFLSDGQVFCQ